MSLNLSKAIAVHVAGQYFVIYGCRLLQPVSVNNEALPIDLNPTEYRFPSIDSPDLLELLRTIESLPGGLDPNGKELLAIVKGDHDSSQSGRSTV